MTGQAPVIAVIGHKNSGKTTVIISLVRELTRLGYRVAAAKHVHQRGFSMDTEGKDTWYYGETGAKPVISVSDAEIAVLRRNGEAQFTVNTLHGLAPESDVILLEGFSQLVLTDKSVGKILCVKDTQEYDDFREKVEGEIIAFCSQLLMDKPVLRIDNEFQILMVEVVKYIQGHSRPMTGNSKIKLEIMINGSRIPIEKAHSETLRGTMLLLVSSLCGVAVRGDENVQLRIDT